MQFTLRQLHYAVSVADTGHFGQAALRCHVSQPALSQQIAQLEIWCGAPLFDRTRRGARLTPFGREFLERARTVLAAAGGLEALVAGRAEAPDRPVRFGLIPTVAPYLLPDLFPALRRDLPRLSFTVSEGKTDALLDGLLEGTLDVALIATKITTEAMPLRAEMLFEDSFYLATPPGEPHPGPVDLAALSPDRLLLLDEGHCLRDQALAACRLAPGDTARAFAATSLATIVEFVANGQGVTLLPSIAIRKEAEGNRIAIHSLAAPGMARHLSLVWREGNPFARSYRSVADVIRATCAARPS